MTNTTAFAPAVRADKSSIQEHNIQIAVSEHIKAFIDGMPNIVLILNRQRQIVFYNAQLMRDLCITDDSQILGIRPGELFSCIHSCETEGGCGTTEYCRYCGAVIAILSSQVGEHATRECRMTVRRNERVEAIELRVNASPVWVHDEFYTLFSITNISEQKRMEVLEQIFFHDILNSAFAIYGLADNGARTDDPEMMRSIMTRLPDLTKGMIEDIKAQRQLLLAERDELSLEFGVYSIHNLFDDAIQYCRSYSFAKEKAIVIHKESKDVLIATDQSILRRVLINLIKNALEASSKGDAVTISCLRDADTLKITIHNSCEMAPEVKMQMFQRSFSTKGKGRGIGTYSILLLTERYLQGSVSFTSDAEFGTIFMLRLPLVLTEVKHSLN